MGFQSPFERAAAIGPRTGELVAVAVVCGADTDGKVTDLVRRVPALAGTDATAVEAWAGWLRDLYPSNSPGEGWLGILQPDLVAEILAVEVLTGYDPDQRRATFAGVTAGQATQALTVLGRAAVHHGAEVDAFIADILAADTAVMTEAVIATGRQFPGRFVPRLLPLLADALDGLPLDRCRRLALSVPWPSLELHPVAVRLTIAITARTRATTDLADRATWLNWHGLRLTEAGRWAEALIAAEDAVTLRRELAAANRDAHLPKLASSVNDAQRRRDKLNSSDSGGAGQTEDVI